MRLALVSLIILAACSNNTYERKRNSVEYVYEESSENPSREEDLQASGQEQEEPSNIDENALVSELLESEEKLLAVTDLLIAGLKEQDPNFDVSETFKQGLTNLIIEEQPEDFNDIVEIAFPAFKLFVNDTDELSDSILFQGFNNSPDFVKKAMYDYLINNIEDLI